MYKELLEKEGLNITFKKVGDYMTSIDMAGVSLTLVKIEDPTWVEYLHAPVNTIGW